MVGVDSLVNVLDDLQKINTEPDSQQNLDSSSSAQTVVLIGAGHLHLYVITHAAALIAHNARVVLIDPGDFWYSGLATGMLGGHYSAAADRIDVQALAQAHGVTCIKDYVASVDTSARQVCLASGTILSYDHVSLNLGSQVDVDGIAGAANDPSVYLVKPISQLWKLREHLQTGLRNHLRTNETPQIVVVGGGATGCEVAANLAALARKIQSPVRVTLCTSGERLIPHAPIAASQTVQRELIRSGVKIRSQVRINKREGATLLAVDNQRIPADLVVVATGLKAHPLMQASGLPTRSPDTDSRNADKRGGPKISGLRINCHLQSIADPHVFAGGDCAALEGFDLPKLGVYGVRQASHLHANLVASLAHKPLSAFSVYQPQQRVLTILNLGNGTALATWGRFWWHGRSSMWLKHFIDQRFLKKYRRMNKL